MYHPHPVSGMTSPQVPTLYQQPNAQQIQNPHITSQLPPNQPWARNQGLHVPWMGNVNLTQPPGSNCLGNQPSAEVKPPSQAMNQPTKPVNQGSYGYPQQPNMFPGQVQNYQPQVVGQPGLPVRRGCFRSQPDNQNSIVVWIMVTGNPKVVLCQHQTNQFKAWVHNNHHLRVI